MNKDNKNVVDYSDYPLEKKLCLTIEEASVYSGISVNGIRAMTHALDCNFLLYPPKRGQKVLIKRVEFEKYINSMSTHFGTEVTK